MVLKSLLEILLPNIDENINLDRIYNTKEIVTFNLVELLEVTDQEIDDFVKNSVSDPQKQKLLFDIYQKLKLEQSIKNLKDNVEEEEAKYTKNIIQSMFSQISEPNKIEITETEVSLTYDFSQGSKLKEKVEFIDKWNRDNVIDTVSKEFNVMPENISYVESISDYIEFISGFEDNNFVSRGQKDCTYKLEPSLHRIYKDGHVGHSLRYESVFKQRILYYDNSTENKHTEELRAYGQHFGLPTNYLDFTEAHLISLLFAVEEYEYINNHAIVYFVDAFSYNKETIKSERKLVDFSDDKLRESTEREYSDKSYFIRVGNCNERIHFQKGCFLKVMPRDSLKRMLEIYTKIAIIDKNSKEKILKELFKLGITFENIYPDKDNMVKTIRFNNEHL